MLDGENLSGLPIKVKLHKIKVFYKNKLTQRWKVVYADNEEFFIKLASYSGTSLFIAIPSTIIAFLLGKPLTWFLAFFFLFLFFLPFFEHYYIWLRKGWSDEYYKNSDEEKEKFK